MEDEVEVDGVERKSPSFVRDTEAFRGAKRFNSTSTSLTSFDINALTDSSTYCRFVLARSFDLCYNCSFSSKQMIRCLSNRCTRQMNKWFMKGLPYEQFPKTQILRCSG